MEKFLCEDIDNPYPIKYGKEGSLPLTVFNKKHPVKSIIYSAAEECYYEKQKPDSKLGYLEKTFISDGGERLNFAKLFLTPIKSRKNLFVSLKTEVIKVLFPCYNDKKPAGVLANVNGIEMEIKAKREVILSAGAINTAKILLLSGIGPKKHLQQHNIPVRGDLQVGRNLQNHYVVPILVAFEQDWESPDILQQYIDNLYEFLVHKTGLFVTHTVNGLYGSINTLKEKSKYPNIGIYHHYFPANDSITIKTFFSSILKYSQCVAGSILVENKKSPIILFGIELLKPKSRGTVQLKSANAKLPPVINNNFLSDVEGEDYVVLESGFKYIMKIIDSLTLDELNARLVKPNIPPCRNFKFCSEAYVKCYIRNMGYAMPHMVGTAKLGMQCDSTGVVDENLVVHGFRSLRVIDGSILPDVTTVNPYATIAMIADKMSDTIKEKWSKMK